MKFKIVRYWKSSDESYHKPENFYDDNIREIILNRFCSERSAVRYLDKTHRTHYYYYIYTEPSSLKETTTYSYKNGCGWVYKVEKDKE